MLPATLRENAGLHEGTVVTLVDTPQGIVLLTREKLRDWVRRDLEGLDLVAELLADRRQAADDDVA